jgi:hypothetical protein
MEAVVRMYERPARPNRQRESATTARNSENRSRADLDKQSERRCRRRLNEEFIMVSF